MFLTKSLYALGISALLVFLAGCNAQNDGGEGSTGTTASSQSHVIDLSLSSLYSGVTSKSAAAKQTTAVSSVLTGTLQAINYTTNKITNYDWSATLDESALTIQSIKTLTLEPGSYHFTLLLSDASYQYAGDSYATITDGNASDISMTLAPVIGDTVIDISAVSTLSDYHFTFDTEDLSSIYSPKLGITVDSGLEQIFTINKLTGLTDSYLNLPEGPHTIKLALYEDTEQVGRSIPEQENVTIVAGSPLTMNIVPLHAETTFTFDVTTGGAIIKTIIPNEILEIAPIQDLDVILTLTDGNTSYEKNMNLGTENNTTYGITSFGSVTSDPLAYGDYAMQLEFIDITNPSIPIGSCLMDNIALDKNQSNFECSVSVSNPTLASSTILASVGINVYDTDSYPVSGALVYANDAFIGITGNGTFGTAGYLAVDLPSGELTIKAIMGQDYGSIDTTLNPLAVKNFDIILNQSGTANSFDLFGDSSAVALYTFDTDRNDIGGTYDTNYTGTTLSSAHIENGVAFLTSNDSLKLLTPLPSLPQYSVSLFTDANTSASGNGWELGQLLYLTENNSLSLYVWEDLYVLEHNQSNGQVVTLFSNSTISSLGGGFHHITVTADGSNLKMYLDGSLDANTTYDGTNAAITYPYGDWIGNHPYYYGQDEFYNAPNGIIDQLRIFNRAVTQDEINQLLNEQ